MKFEHVPLGTNPPYDINTIIEVAVGSDPIKYEIDKKSNMLVIDRFMYTSMTYPCNYGFVPHTLSEDGDPLDVLLLCSYPLQPNCVASSRPIGVLLMEDEKGLDEKILAVPHKDISSYYDNIKSVDDIPKSELTKISHFFEHYKDLEDEKWVTVIGWRDEVVARQIIRESIDRHLATANT